MDTNSIYTIVYVGILRMTKIHSRYDKVTCVLLLSGE